VSDDADPPEGDDGTAAGPSSEPVHDRRMLEALVCPQTRAPLSYDSARRELVSKAAHLAYPIRKGIPVMLIDEARALD
jgi:uncharacterized protein YbaR (Trm112 family)